MTTLLKEDYIHVSHNSITSELCSDILNIFERNIIKNNLYIESKNCCYEIIDTDYNKIRIYLKNELIKNLIKFFQNINKHSINTTILNHSYFEDMTFFIKKDKYTSVNNVEINHRFNWNVNGFKMFNFIWFLNDVNGDFVFWNNYRIRPKKGTLIVFPSSWCFPCEQIVKTNSEMNTIYGYLYKKKQRE